MNFFGILFFGLVAATITDIVEPGVSRDVIDQSSTNASLASEKASDSPSTSTNTGNKEDPPNKGFNEFIQNFFGFTWKPFETNISSFPPISSVPPGETVTPSKNCPSCKCGVANTQNRIVGGMETKMNYYSWMTMLTYRGDFYCAGTLINVEYVLTAAHCVDRLTPELINAWLLVHDRDATNDSRVQKFGIKKVIKHSGYSNINYNNDIALLKLNDEVKFSGTTGPACLPPLGTTFAGDTGIVTGWGATSEAGSTALKLQEVMVPILTNEQCKNTKYPSRRITENMMCAGYTQGGKDSCQGDSGGPLHVLKDSTYSIAGIVSWGEGCARPNYPGVYTRVNRYVSWIKHNTRDACYC